MKTITQRLFTVEMLTGALFDVFALVFVYCVPAITHLLDFPVYYIEPMRLMLILAMVYSGRYNTYILAFTLPVFSYFISAHPVFPKMLLICTELLLNALLFYSFKDRIKHTFYVVILSITISKVVYYFLKMIMIKAALINADFFSTPVLIQVITTVLFGLYVSRFYKRS
jgi:hypothetical protein